MIRFPDQFNLANYYLFDRLDEGLGDKVAVRYGDLSYTYDDVARRTQALAGHLQSAGVQREERVYIVLPDTPPFAWSLFAVLAGGAVVAMGNPASPVDDLRYVVDYIKAAAVITTPAAAESLAGCFARASHLRTVLLVPETPTGKDPEAAVDIPAPLQNQHYQTVLLSDVVKATVTGDNRVATHRDCPCMWLFTSGSTGRPKAAIHTHRDFAFNTEVYAKGTVGYRPDDVTVSVPRLFFGYSTGTNLMFPFAVGATSCLYSERPTPETLAAAIEMYRPTVITNVPTMMSKLLDHDDALAAAGKRRLDLSTVRFHLSAGEALPPSLLDRFTERFANDVYDGIGSAEMFHIYASNRPGDIKPGSLGRPVEGYDIRILPVDAEGPGVAEVPRGETGVMWVRGDSVSMGYYLDRDKSWSTFHGHWCCTGDLFRMDEDGYLWFEGRADSLFKVGGIWVAPLEIEECLGRHPSVAMAVVIPARHEGLDKPKAFVVVREGHQESVAHENGRVTLCSALQEHVKSSLSKHKYPRWVIFVDDLPRNDRGKIDRKTLIEREQAGENPWA